uniref:Uncharacterized protein n=1 Tax=Strigamia maritima TaxID=126957 RepID=T1JKG2_STRMM
MSDFNKKLSGFQKRKQNKEKFEKEKELLRNVPKLNTFFVSSTSRPSSGSSPSTSSTSALASGSCSDAADDHQQAIPTNVSDCNELPENIISENPVTALKNDSLENPESNSSLSDDPAKWMLDEVTLEYLVQNGVKQNIDADFSSSRRQYADKTRYLLLSLFSRT